MLIGSTSFVLLSTWAWLFPIPLEANRITFWKHCWCCFSDFSLFSFVCDKSNHHINYFLYFPRNRLRWVLIDNPTQLTVIHDKCQKKKQWNLLYCYFFFLFFLCVCVCVWGCVCVSVFMGVRACVCVCVCVYASISLYDCLHVSGCWWGHFPAHPRGSKEWHLSEN